MFVLIAHWLACVWYTIGDHEFSEAVQYGWLTTLLDDTSCQQQDHDPDVTDHARRPEATVATVLRPSTEMSYLTALDTV